MLIGLGVWSSAVFEVDARSCPGVYDAVSLDFVFLIKLTRLEGFQD